MRFPPPAEAGGFQRIVHMKKYRILILCLILAFLIVQVAPGSLAGAQGARAAPNAPEDFPILRCTATGITGDLADSRGIRFTVSQSFKSVEVRMAASVAGSYSFTAELRRSTGFTDEPIATVNVNAGDIPASTAGNPYMPVTVDFESVSVSGEETFTLAFIDVSGQGSLYFETYGIGTMPCAKVEETEENNVANPTVRGDPAGFKVLAPSPSAYTLSSPFAITPPTIDGKLSFGEWANSSNIPFENGFITVLNDNIRLYVLLDLLDDVGDDADDYFWLIFDVDRDGVIDANQDLLYSLDPNTGNMRYSYFTGPGTLTSMQPQTYSSRAKGFGCFLADGTSFFKMKPFSSSCKKHRLWEFAIDLDEIDTSAGGSARLSVRANSGTPAFTNDVPQYSLNDFSSMIEISLGSSPYYFLAPDPNATVALDAKAIEITQAIQDRDNTLALVSDKTSAARVYVDVNGSPYAQYAWVYLYASVGGVDKPGSPLAMIHLAPTSIDRSKLSKTANFLLPNTWDDAAAVTFEARLKDWYGNPDSSTPFTLNFSPRDVPIVWIVPANMGSAGSPWLVSNDEIASQESAMKASMPVRNITFVRKDWSAIGTVTDLDDAIAKLNTFHSQAVLAWVLTVIFTGSEPFALPDQIYGFTPSGGGTSDPVWYYGNGYVASGFRGSSGELTMTHEINHNLDRDPSGTWGRHDPYDCGAAGPNPAWPYANDDIQEVGFDTRLPWQDLTTLDTVVPSNWPDFMSYCDSGQLPTKWIAPYRWTNQYNRFAIPLEQSMMERIDQIQLVYYVSGWVKPDGTGALDPVVEEQGIPSEEVVEGEYSIEVLDRLGATMFSLPFGVNFEDIEGGQRTLVPFNFQIPYQKGATQIVLKHGADTLASQEYSTNPPVINIVEPATIQSTEAISGQITIQWEATDADGDLISVDILYSPDLGQNWFPVVSDLTGDSYVVDTANLVGGEQAIFRVIASDGFRNDQDDLDTPLVIADNPPLVSIAGPAQAPFGSTTVFHGSGMDPEDGELPPEALNWELDGEAIDTGGQIEPLFTFGEHTLVLYGVDSAGNTGQATLVIFIGNHLYLPVIEKE
jgi:hypothetical protein